MKILFLEDNQDEQNTYKSTITRIESEKGVTIETSFCRNFEEAQKILDNSYDGAIVDLKIGDVPDEGNQLVNKIISNFKIPTVIFTGTPDDALLVEGIPVHLKGEVRYDEILDYFQKISDTGISRILGGQGAIEVRLREIFWKSLLPSKDSWIKHKNNGINTENSILKVVTNQLTDLLESRPLKEDERDLGEEMYIVPIITSFFATGSVVKKDGKEFVVLSPACDMVVYEKTISKGVNEQRYKTSKVLLCEIDSFNELVTKLLSQIVKPEKKKDKIKEIITNNYAHYYHWLPPFNLFDGGLLNFRHVVTVEFTELSKFTSSNLKIAQPFIKDIISRFSSYYARQGQPNFSFDQITAEILDDITKLSQSEVSDS